MSNSTNPDVALPKAPDANAPTQTYTASCHCGAFAYSVTASPPLSDPSTSVMNCNCSICVHNGYLFIHVPDARVTFTRGSVGAFKKYSFNTQRMAHYFCGTCGSSCMARSVEPGFFEGMTCVNVRMFEGVDVGGLRLKGFDGRSL